MNPADLSGLPIRFDLLVGLLVEATLAGSAAVLVVLALRRSLRHAFGAGVAYAAWALVPAAVIAVSLPAATVTVPPVTVPVAAGASLLPLAAPALAMPLDPAPWLFAAWLVGVAAMALHLGRQQRAFRRGLGRLHAREDGLQQAETVAGLPAAFGLLRPAIVVPADFDTRYSGEERELMHAHERSHIARGDLQLNALVALLRSVFWFNPLLHHAVRHFRHDQELACDQRVIARHPHGRRAYGEAMFKTQLASQPMPLGCHWAALDKARTHPLKERIAMLKQPIPTATRWVGGGTLVLVLALGVGFTAWSAQPKREVLAADQLPPLPSTPSTPPAPPAPMAAIAPTPPAPPMPLKAGAGATPALAPLPPPAPPAPPAPPKDMVAPPPAPPIPLKAADATPALAPLPPPAPPAPSEDTLAPLPPVPAVPSSPPAPTPKAGLAPAASAAHPSVASLLFGP
jgi:beta-lactamase regulating signal transducer with metallopeptidase domain